jgi:hypothetical protein
MCAPGPESSSQPLNTVLNITCSLKIFRRWTSKIAAPTLFKAQPGGFSRLLGGGSRDSLGQTPWVDSPPERRALGPSTRAGR